MTPTLSQGGKSEIVARIDWLTATTTAPLDVVLDRADDLFGVPGTRMERGRYGYTSGMEYPGGATITWSEGRADVCLTLPGEACGALGTERVVKFGLSLAARPSRVDIALDGLEFTPRMVRDAWCAGEVVTKTHADSWQWYESATGETMYIGAPSSDRRARCYTKLDDTRRVAADGSPIVRWETQYRRERARGVWELLSRLSSRSVWDELGALALGLVADHLRFTAPGSQQRNVSERLTALWWSAFVAGADRVRVAVAARVGLTLDRLDGYLRRQVGASLATWVQAHAALGRDVYAALNALITLGDGRMRSRHHAVVAGVSAGV